jgi:hypothetical protein
LRLVASSQSLVNLLHQVGGRDIPESGVLHNPIEYLFVPLHAVNEEAFEHPLKHMLEIVECVDLCRRFKRFVFNRCLGDLIEKELIRGLKIGSEAFVELIDELR